MSSYIRGMLQELNFNTIGLIIKDKNNNILKIFFSELDTAIKI